MATAIFELSPIWNADGDNEFHLLNFVDLAMEIDDAVATTSPLLQNSWTKPKIKIVEKGRSADVYFGIGNHFFFSARAREIVAPTADGCVEWLPVDSDDLGRHYLMHPLRQIPLGPESRFRCNPVSGNMTVIDEYAFERASIGTTTVFYPSQVQDSAAARCGFCYAAVMVVDVVMSAIISNTLSGVHGVLRAKIDV